MKREEAGVRIAVFGVSGSGKSTLARRLAAALGVPHVELDAINWQAGWHDLNTHDLPEFRRRVARAVAGEGWVSDGNYGRVRDLVLARATHVIWLDYPRSLVMRRVLWRSLRRAATRREVWPGTGNREAFRQWLDADHPVRWAWRSYPEQRRTYAALLANPALAHLERHRLRHPGEVEPLLRRLLAQAGHEAGRER